MRWLEGLSGRGRDTERGPFNEITARDIPNAIRNADVTALVVLVNTAFVQCPRSTADPRRLLRQVAGEIEEAYGAINGPIPVEEGFEREQALRTVAQRFRMLAAEPLDRDRAMGELERFASLRQAP